MGCFRPEFGPRLWLIAFGFVKVPLLLMATMGLCLPGFAAASVALGLGSTLRLQVRAIMAGQAAFACALASMAPLTLVFYASGVSHRWALLWNTAVFLVATLAAQVVIRRLFAPLIASDRRHRVTLALWVVLYALVGTQAGWILRPFVGTPNKEVTFLRDEPFSNAYIVMWDLVKPKSSR